MNFKVLLRLCVLIAVSFDFGWYAHIFIDLAPTEKQLRFVQQDRAKNTNNTDECRYESSLEHELSLREVQRVSTEFWWYMKKELTLLKQPNTTRQIDRVMLKAVDIQRKLQNDLYELSNTVDHISDWRKQESKTLSDLVWRRINYLQNPKDCKKASKIVCELDNKFGFGCELHHVTHCLISAYATQRTLILDSKRFSYTSGGWETLFQPLSETCNSTSGKVFNGIDESKTVYRLPVIQNLKINRPNYLPLAIPEDLANRIRRFHGNPAAWWIGQFVQYALRPNSMTQKKTLEKIRKLGFEGPIVGVHVRRTDKLNKEAKFYGVEEYMEHVEEWFNAYEHRHPGIQRRIYIATDEPAVLNQTMAEYPAYTIISNPDATDFAKNKRYSADSLMGIYLDIYLLSMCDYLVCTFSSNVCRAAYELMQTRHGDASSWITSLDKMYYFHGQNPHFFEAVENHTAANNGEISFSKGQLIDVYENLRDGYSKGRHKETGKVGLFPSYKVADTLQIVKYPKFPEI